ncbi:MAG: hypothetical protein HC876_16475 [Chloroflexaceae bacterium]|nr:hypothetical protein [Chloroflexaceae bacterium]
MSDYEYARLLPSHQVDATTGMPVVRFHPAWLFWGYLLLLATIEAITALTDLRIGLVLHVGLLFGLTLHSSLGATEAERRLALVLTMVPLIRTVSLALP